MSDSTFGRARVRLESTEIARLDHIVHEREHRTDDDRLGSVVETVETLLAARFSVVIELHAPFECCNVRCAGGGWHCRTCEEGLAAEGGNVHWPCPTLRAVGVTGPPEQAGSTAGSAAGSLA